MNFAMMGLDALLTVCRPLRRRGGEIAPPRRVLICNFAHLGDLVVATSILPVIKSAFPDCRIGFLIGSWARAVLQDHPLVDDIHFLDHWAANRAHISKQEKFRQYWRTRRQALGEVKAARYDAALDLHWGFPNVLPFLWQARIPARIGYNSAGSGPLATHDVGFDARPLSIIDRHLTLVQKLPVRTADIRRAAPTLPAPLAEEKADLERILSESEISADSFVIFHAGAGLSMNVWDAAKWRALAEQFSADGVSLAFTGAGERDAALIESITAGLPRCVSLCDRLGWGGFVAAITQARLLVCVDTVASHIAAAVGTPCAVIVTGRHPYRWHTPGPTTQVLMHPVPCAPCHRGLGCAGMECIRNLEVERVYQAGRLLLESSDRASVRP